jgi:8-oxo-dGTP pyrophosphatase MutT (NUDIX family)
MMRLFNDATRRNIADLCAAFTRAAPADIAPDLKRAAVAIVLTGAGEEMSQTSLLLTRRAAGLRSHRAQWALPGGRCDAGETQVEAALRELHEELGLQLEPDAVLGQLDDYPTRLSRHAGCDLGGFQCHDVAESGGGRLRAPRRSRQHRAH